MNESDWPWLRALIEQYERFAGRRRIELDERLRQGLHVDCPAGKLGQAAHVMERLCRDRVRAAVPPPEARAALALEAARGGSRQQVLERAGARLKQQGELLVECMLADLPGERRVSAPPSELSPSQLALRVNAAIARSLMARCDRVQLFLSGNARDIVRHARLKGLLCSVRRVLTEAGEERTVLDISGPLALFKHTTVYGRALGSLVPRLCWCDRFLLRARYRVGGQTRLLVVRSGDPIFPAEEPRRFDSKLEARFFAEFSRAAPGWQLVREPEPVRAGERLIFPDFALFRHQRPEKRWLLEIVGFWTAEYLAGKLRALRAARIDNLILCIDQERNCSEQQLPGNAIVVPYRRRIDPAAVLKALETRGASSP